MPFFKPEKKRKEATDRESGENDREKVESMVAEEKEMWDEAGRNIAKEKDENVGRKKARRLTTFMFATLAAVSAVVGKSSEARAQEMHMDYVEAPTETKANVDRLEDLGVVEMVEEYREKLQKLKEAFGDDIDFISWLLHSGINQQLKELNGYVLGDRPTPDRGRLKQLKEGWSERNDGIFSSLKERSIEVEGFDDFSELNEDSNLDNSDIRELVEDKYSDSWLASVKDIAFVPESRIISTTIQGNTVTFAKLGNSLSARIKAEIDRTSPRDSVTIFPLPEHSEMDTEKFVEGHISPMLDHELAHSNDWENSLVLSVAERMDFLSEALEYYKRDGRFTNPHLEAAEKAKEIERQMIADKRPDLELGLYAYMSVKEYWANLAMAYFQKPEILQEQYPEEYEFVEKWVDIINAK